MSPYCFQTCNNKQLGVYDMLAVPHTLQSTTTLITYVKINQKLTCVGFDLNN